MPKHNAGFSMLELLVSMAIIGILSAIAIPSYTGYITRAKLAEVFMLADAQKIKIVDKLTNGAQFKCSNAGGSVARPLSQHVENMVTWEDKGEYVIQLKAAQALANNKTGKDLIVEFRGVERDDIITWECAVAKEYGELLSGRCLERDIALHSC